MEGCPHCKNGRAGNVRFGAYQVRTCDRCHALGIRPLVDPRLPTAAEHIKILRAEIREEEDAAADRAIRAEVQEARRHRDGATLRLQLVEGKARVPAGSRWEAFPEKAADEEAANLEVTRSAGVLLEVVVDRRDWADLRVGARIQLRAPSAATLLRNLLKAFLLLRRLAPGDELLQPQALPRLKKPAETPWPGLDVAQSRAVHAGLALPDGGLLLVHGPPGTGKTSVIAKLVREAVAKRWRVLVTSHTHVAIDNALRKAMRADPALSGHLVRLGESGRVADDMAQWARRVGEFRDDPEKAAEEGRAMEGLFARLQQRHAIVGMTLDALAVSLLASEQNGEALAPWDLVIVDEAGMNSYPKLAVARAVGRRTVLVGDPLQLPPILRAPGFRNDETYKRSHFEALQMLRPDLSVLLDTQYRCDPRIYDWSAHAIYAGRVRSATKPRPAAWTLFGSKLAGPVIWVDTSRMPAAQSEVSGTSRINPTHVELAQKAAHALLGQGLVPGDIGYITPFRAQAELWRAGIEDDAKLRSLAAITASTVDAFQGAERRAIIFDFTTLHPAKPHQDHRRLNVSLTRAQDLLIVLGRRDFVQNAEDNPFYASLQRWAEPQVVVPR